ncbi:MAG: HAD family phosphatase [Flavobacteriales bacterium]
MGASDRYDTIILDLGGVLINVDYTASARAFAQLGFSGFDELYSKSKQDGLFDRFETGSISPAQFRDRIRQLSELDLTDAQINGCWDAMLGSIPQERIALVQRLKECYKVLLLSNTNAIHVPAFEAIVAKENGITDFKGLFDGAYFSCELGMRKPNADIFHYVLAKNDAAADRTLFIDDSIQHVEGARKAGLHAEHLDLGKEDLLGLVQRLGLLAH